MSVNGKDKLMKYTLIVSFIKFEYESNLILNTQKIECCVMILVYVSSLRTLVNIEDLIYCCSMIMSLKHQNFR